MRLRPAQRTVALLAALILASSLGACGGGADAPVAGGPPREGRYAGRTAQGLPISFIVSGTTVRDLSFGWRATCEDGQVHTNTIALPGGGIHYSVFSSGGRLETGGIAHVQGKFDGEEFAGELSRSRGSAFGTNCRATGIKWSAEFLSDAAPAVPDPAADGVSS